MESESDVISTHFMANGRLGDHSFKLKMGLKLMDPLFLTHNSIFFLFCLRTCQVREDSKDGESYRIHSSKTRGFDIPFCHFTDNIILMSIYHNAVMICTPRDA